MDNSYNNIAGRDTEDLLRQVMLYLGSNDTLVLEIKVPEVKGTDKELMMAFLGLLPKFMVYFLSFMTAGIFWMGQSAQFDLFLEK
jgi:carbohydrate-binding DOMON domain-containing protein